MGHTEVHPERLAAVARVEAEAASCVEISDSIHLLIAHLSDLLCADGVVVDLVRDDQMVTCYSTESFSHEVGRVQQVDSSMLGVCLRADTAVRSPNVRRDPRFTVGAEDPAEFVSMISVPVYVHGPAVGIVRVMSRNESFFDDEDVSLARLTTGAMARILIHAVRRELDDEREDESLLAGIGAAGDFEDRRKAQLRHADRYGYAVSLVVCRIGGYLDSEVLHQLSSHIRKTDDCFRLDAGEFAILMPGTTVDEARIAGARIKRAIEAGADGGLTLDWEARPLSPREDRIA